MSLEIIKFDRVLSVNSEIQNHGAALLLQSKIDTKNCWLCQKGTEKAVVILKMERATVISSVHIGNAHSAFIEVLTGRATDGDVFQTLIPTSTFMTPNESKQSENPNQVRFFSTKDFDPLSTNQQWDLIKIVCSQPFNKQVSFGLCFINIHGETNKQKVTLKQHQEETIAIGSFFRKKKAESSADDVRPPPTVSERIRDAEKPEALAKHTPLRVGKITPVSEKQSPSSSIGKRKEPMEERVDNRKNRDLGLEDDRDQSGTDRSHYIPEKRKKITTKKKEDDPSTQPQKTQREQRKPETSKRTNPVDSKSKTCVGRRKPFDRLMDDVVFVLSGYQNPLRGEIRSKVLEMGGKYRQEWSPQCTHLIAAFINTPKCKEVSGKGKIVSHEWIEKCYKDRKRYPSREYALDKKNRHEVESDEEIIEEQRAEEETAEYEEYEEEMITDDDNRKNNDLSDLPEFFHEDFFFVDPDIKDKPLLERYILAYNGVVADELSERVRYFITMQKGAVLKVLKNATNYSYAVSPTWILAINHAQKYLPPDNFLVD